MGFEVACRCGRPVEVVAGDAGSSVRCACGREVAVPSLSELRRSLPPPPVVPPKWECPRCRSTAVERLPPSSITPHPGYKCHGCGAKLRARGMGVVYGVVLLLGAVLFALFASMPGDRGRGLPISILWVAGASAVYSGVQLLRPVPRWHSSTTDSTHQE